MATAYQTAASMAGTHEGQAALSDFLRTGGVNLDPNTKAWCAAFVNATLNKSGQKGTDSDMARSFLNWGQKVSDPQVGDIAVFSRGDPNGPFGHVGFYSGTNEDGSIKVLGGNQSDAVSYANYPANRLLGYRRAGYENPNEALGGDSMVARNQAPETAAAANTPMGGILGQTPFGQQVAQDFGIGGGAGGIDPNDLRDKKEGGILGALAKGLEAFGDGPSHARMGPMGDARQTGMGLLEYLSGPGIAGAVSKRRGILG